MFQMMSPISLTCSPTLANIIGTVGTDSLLKSINEELNSSFFGSIDDILSVGRQMFIENAINPNRNIGNCIKNVIGMFEHDDVFRTLKCEDDLKHIPECMHDSILRYAPIKSLFDQARIFGFGYDYVSDDDIYKRLIDNGNCDNVNEAINSKGEFTLEYHFESTDPDLTFEEIESIRDTRAYIDYILENTDIDPTDYPNMKA